MLHYGITPLENLATEHMNLPSYYKCSSCHEEFSFKFRSAYYYAGTAPFDKKLVDAVSLGAASVEASAGQHPTTTVEYNRQ